MGYGRAAVMPSSGNEITEEEVSDDRSQTSLMSVQSEPASALTKPKSQKQQHRRHFSMFSGDGDRSRLSTSSSRSKWDWKLGDLWHSRSIGKKSEKRELVPAVSIDSSIASDENTNREPQLSPSPPLALARAGSASLHYTSLGIFTSSKFSSSDLEVSGDSGSSGESGSAAGGVASRWREIQGGSDWENLLDPLDPDVRSELLRYGDLAQMAYDNFEDARWSKYAGSAKYSKRNVFDKLHKSHMGYQVTRYLYATCENPPPGILQSSLSSEKWDVESNWMGFVAVTEDEKEMARLGRRDIVVSWRGTSRNMEWLVDAQIQLAPMTLAPDNHHKKSTTPSLLKPKVEKGFWSLYTCKRSKSQFNQKSASEQVIRELTRLLTLYKGETLSITITGHSLGGALAILTAYEIADSGLNKQTAANGDSITIPVTVFSFGSPRIGDAIFKRRFEELQLKALHVVNIHDIVPKAIGGLHPPWSEAYKHVGVELQVNSKLSPYLKPTRDPHVWHNLECYLHHIDGHQGVKANDGFQLVTGRDIALVNKYLDALKSECCVPGYWWQTEKKGLVLNEEGRWIEPDRNLEDVPSLENKENFI